MSVSPEDDPNRSDGEASASLQESAAVSAASSADDDGAGASADGAATALGPPTQATVGPPETGAEGGASGPKPAAAAAGQAVPGEDPDAMAPEHVYKVALPTFEGPLDLLLHLIQKHELDILDIPIAFITEKYIEYMNRMQELSIDVASEYLVMAATLAHIKSKMLLPPSEEEEEESDEPEEDPRLELVRRLLEYQKYKLAGEELGSRSLLGRDLFARGIAAPQAEGPAPLAPVSLFKLMDAFEGVLKRLKKTEQHTIDFERISISDRINQLSDILRERQRVAFHELFEGDRTRADVVVTFLALLEMTRLRLTRLFQTAPYGPIQIELAVLESSRETDGAAAEAAPEAAQRGSAAADPLVEAASQSGEEAEARPAEEPAATEPALAAAETEEPAAAAPEEPAAAPAEAEPFAVPEVEQSPDQPEPGDAPLPLPRRAPDDE